MNSICFNGRFLPSDQPIITADNRPYRFGDGIFESMKIWKGKIMFEKFHEERLFPGLSLLKIRISENFTWEKFRHEIIQLCQMNNCENLCRVRLSVFRGHGLESFQYIIESWPLEPSINDLNDVGFNMDVFPHGYKCADQYSPLKTTNFIAYVMAIEYANENKLDDCILLNQYGNVADSTISSVFICKDQQVITPSLDQGSTNGVMRRYLIENLQESGHRVIQRPVTISDRENADEVFLTNAIRGIRWVRQFRAKTYGNQQAKEIYTRCLKTLFQ